jgi:hypothetical protein
MLVYIIVDRLWQTVPGTVYGLWLGPAAPEDGSVAAGASVTAATRTAATVASSA